MENIKTKILEVMKMPEYGELTKWELQLADKLTELFITELSPPPVSDEEIEKVFDTMWEWFNEHHENLILLSVDEQTEGCKKLLSLLSPKQQEG